MQRPHSPWPRILLALFVIEVAAFVVLALATHGAFGPMPEPVSTDFISFYAAGRLTNDGMPELVYDPAMHQLTEQAIFGDPHLRYHHFFYPPVFLLFCQVLAQLPYMTAQILFLAISLLLWGGALYGIMGRTKIALVLVTFPPLFYAAGLVQNSFLTAAVFGFATLLGDRRPWAAGTILGLQCFKPHFLAVAPLALIAGKRWRVLAGLALSVTGLMGLTLILYGPLCWKAFVSLAMDAPTPFETGLVPPSGLVSVFGAARLVGLSPPLAYGLQAIAGLVACAILVRVWATSAPLSVRASALMAATALTVPVILFYDLLPLSVAIAWMIRDAEQEGCRRGERAMLALVWVLTAIAMPVAELTQIPLGPLPAGLILALSMARNSRLPIHRTA